jgi:hypothetical protein
VFESRSGVHGIPQEEQDRMPLRRASSRRQVIALPFKYLVRLLPFLPAVLLGGVGGALLGGPALGMAGAGILFALWLVRRRMTT